ncbi:MAG: uncharacterized protein QOE56_2388 [Solirubrobacterales bacterium]|jgi:predicted TIM-barrel fold metal-dependent hydrolase|nr:uncharacterized protein [Solirubrobacterales bacterium]
MAPADGDSGIRLIDCDVHPTFRNGIQDIGPYLTPDWKQRFGIGDEVEIDHLGNPRASLVDIPRSPFYHPITGALRQDAFGPDGAPPCTDPQFTAQHHLDAHEVDRAVLLGGNVLTLGAFVEPNLAAVLASAHNDWLEETWLEADPRYRGAAVVAPQDPARAVAEIHRVAERSNSWVAVWLPLMRPLMGEEHYYPIYEAAAAHGMPIVLHLAGAEGTFQNAPTLAGGTPSTYFEFKSMYPSVYMNNMISLVLRGVFERFPSLRVGFIECGIGWLPEALWRMDTNWKALRDEAPWVKRLPSEYVFENVRFASQPFVEPPNNKQIRDFCEMIHVEKTLMFASDYPHYDFDDPMRTLALVPKEARRAVQATTALDTFGERLRWGPREAAAAGAAA